MTDTPKTATLVERLRRHENGSRQQCQCSSYKANCPGCDCGNAADEIGRLRAIFRVNALRWNPAISHAEIDEVLDAIDAPTYSGPARDGIEAQRGLNDVWPGDAL